MALLTPTASKLGIVHKFEGVFPMQHYIDVMTRLLSQTEALVNAQRHERVSVETGRSIRQQQDDAYQASLRADQEKVILSNLRLVGQLSLKRNRKCRN